MGMKFRRTIFVRDLTDSPDGVRGFITGVSFGSRFGPLLCRVDSIPRQSDIDVSSTDDVVTDLNFPVVSPTLRPSLSMTCVYVVSNRNSRKKMYTSRRTTLSKSRCQNLW